MKKLGALVLLLSVIVVAGCSKDDTTEPVMPPSTDITADFDPLFAQVLEKRGYVDDAEHITLAVVKDITALDVSQEE